MCYEYKLFIMDLIKISIIIAKTFKFLQYFINLNVASIKMRLANALSEKDLEDIDLKNLVF